MNIQWIDGTTFIIKNSTGKRILLDPIKTSIDMGKYDLNANIITFNSDIKINSLSTLVSKESKVINSVCNFNNEFINLQGYLTYKDNLNGFKRGENIIYIFEVDGFKLCHLGKLGHQLNYNLINELKKIDFLFIPIGGHFSLNGICAAKLATLINAKYVIPMYYKTTTGYFYLDGPHKFLSSMKDVLNCKDSSIQTNKLSYAAQNKVILLNTL